MLKVIFFGNSGSVLSNRCFRDLSETGASVVAVVDTPPAKRVSTTRVSADTADFSTCARARGIRVFEPATPNTPEFIASASALSPDLLVAAGYMSLLGEHILAVPRIGAVNFHASLLPSYRGKHPVFWTLRNGERWSGMTVHAMDRHLDTGGILYQARVRVRKDDTIESLYDRILARSATLMRQLIHDSGTGRFRPRPQSDAGASYYSSIQEDDFRLDLRRAATELARWIRISPDRCFCDSATGRIYLSDAKARPGEAERCPGTLLRLTGTGCTLNTGKGALRVRLMRLEGETSKPAGQLCRELGLRPGDTFGRA